MKSKYSRGPLQLTTAADLKGNNIHENYLSLSLDSAWIYRRAFTVSSCLNVLPSKITASLSTWNESAIPLIENYIEIYTALHILPGCIPFGLRSFHLCMFWKDSKCLLRKNLGILRSLKEILTYICKRQKTQVIEMLRELKLHANSNFESHYPKRVDFLSTGSTFLKLATLPCCCTTSFLLWEHGCHPALGPVLWLLLHRAMEHCATSTWSTVWKTHLLGGGCKGGGRKRAKTKRDVLGTANHSFIKMMPSSYCVDGTSLWGQKDEVFWYWEKSKLITICSCLLWAVFSSAKNRCTPGSSNEAHYFCELNFAHCSIQCHTLKALKIIFPLTAHFLSIMCFYISVK